MKKTRFQRLVAEVREAFPPLLPTRVYRRRDENLGVTTLVSRDGRPHHFVVVVDDRLCWPVDRLVFIHEWGHVISWSEGHTVEDHGPEWGLAVSRIYQEIVEP